MREAFYEESAGCAKSVSEAKKYTILHVLSIIAFVIAGFIAIYSISAISYIVSAASEEGLSPVFAIIEYVSFFVMFLLLGIGFFLWKRRYNLSYDYVFVEDELRISKVFNGKKRKFLKTLKADQILKIGFCENESYERTLSGMHSKPKFYTPNDEPTEGKRMVYILYSSSVEKTVYIIECRDMMLEYLVRAAGRNKLER
jgi:energy-coupling factor transporter transmembrane protein EcfT